MISLFHPPDRPIIEVLPEVSGDERYLLSELAVHEWEADGFPRQRFLMLPGFEFDGASIPWAVHRFFGGRWSLGLYPPLIHDLLYNCRGVVAQSEFLHQEYLSPDGEWLPVLGRPWTRPEADRLFGRHMKQFGVSWWRRKGAELAVRAMGGGRWKG